MTESYLSANQLLGSTLRTLDDVGVGVTDLILNTEDWSVRFLVAEADAWAPNKKVLVAATSVTGVDEQRRALGLDLTADTLRAHPLVISDDDGPYELQREALPRPEWEGHWRAEMQPELASDAPPIPMDSVEVEITDLLGMDPDFSAERWTRADVLLRSASETADGDAARVIDLLIDNTDWALTYLRVALGPSGSGRPVDAAGATTECLIPRRCIDWLDAEAETLHLAIFEQELRDAPLQPDPTAGSSTQVRMFEG